MSQATKRQREEIERFLKSGDYDHRFAVWPGDTLAAQERFGNDALKRALIDAVQEQTAGLETAVPRLEQDSVAFTRSRVEPMVRGLFSAAEQDQVLAVLERSVVFLTPATICPVLREMMWLHSAWSLANLYLGSIGANLFSDEAPQIVGMSIETTCYVSPEYFAETPRFSDYVVHEAAHIFHNCKRRTVGLKALGGASGCSRSNSGNVRRSRTAARLHSRILKLGTGAVWRLRLVEELAKCQMLEDDRIDRC